MDLVQPVGGLELEHFLVDIFGKQNAPMARRHHLPVHDLHAVEGLGESVQVGTDVGKENLVGVWDQIGDLVFQKFQVVEGVPVEAVPKVVGGSLF